MKIYTKTGDEGLTGVLGGGRLPKNAARIRAIGDVDELNAAIGVARLHSKELQLDATLAEIQRNLFDVGAELASPPEGRIQVRSLEERDVQSLEASIDAQTVELEPLRNFILPGGIPLAAHLHLARAVCRRAERTVLDLHDLEPVRPVVRTYLNRLSDWLFTAARTANRISNVPDVAWEK